ncbi:MAG: PDZ domain-containing protein [Brevundimonas sp.]|nr:PDZ domain-containing protein [Brevundimonas sp.]
MRAGVELVLALALAVQLGRLVWIAAGPEAAAPGPAAVAAAVQPADPSIFQRFDAFFRTGGVSSLAGASAGGSQMRLFGVRAGGADGGSAIIGLADGRQVSVGAGETVEPGLVLQSVGPDHVVLARGGSLSRLDFGDTPVGAAPPPPPPPGPQTVAPPAPAAAVPAAGAGVDAAQLLAQAGLRPRMRGLRLDGFTVSAAGEGSALAAAGLQAGDVLLAVDGTALDSPERIAGLRRQLAGAASVTLRFERDGAVQTTTIRTGR